MNGNSLKVLKNSIIFFAIMTVLCGVIYPGVTTVIAQVAFHDQAEGSIITATLNNGQEKDYGSALIGQEFTDPKYLIGRPMGTTNLSPVSSEQGIKVEERIKWWHSIDAENSAKIPMDLVTASGSGVDPNITPEAADYQLNRIASIRGISKETVQAIISDNTSGRFLWFWGEPAVNVLKVNIALDRLPNNE